MNCKDARKLLSPYLDSELGQTKTFDVSEHLARCVGCCKKFEAERSADEAFRAELARGTMPPQLWSRICKDVSVPGWRRRFRGTGGLALAACLTVLIIGSVALWMRNATDARPWVVRQLAAASPTGAPFAASPGDRAAIERVLGDSLGVRVALVSADAKAAGLHEPEFISASTRTDRDGREYVELRVNCCGQPLLVLLARVVGGALPASFRDSSQQLGIPSSSTDGVNAAGRDIGGVIALVASPHPVDMFIQNLVLTSI